MARPLLISPHLDDAVLSCGGMLAAARGAHVLTVFAGVPPPDAPLPDWDAACGFSGAREAMLARREEDARALSVLGAMPCWLDFLDDQYGVEAPPEALAGEIARAAHGARTVLFPLGLFHRDHRRVAEAVARILPAGEGGKAWVAYEDVPYRTIPGLVEAGLAALAAAGVRARRMGFPLGEPELKRRALGCYASQLRGLGTPGRLGVPRAKAPERYWKLER